MAPRASLKKVHAAAVRETAGGSGQARRIQQGTNKRAGEQLKRLETRRAHAPPRRPQCNKVTSIVYRIYIIFDI